jgi:hypothetical protein
MASLPVPNERPADIVAATVNAVAADGNGLQGYQLEAIWDEDSVHNLAEMYSRAARDTAGGDEATERLVRFKHALGHFAERHGQVLQCHFCAEIPAVVLQTQRRSRAGLVLDDELQLSFPARTQAPSWITDLLFECHSLYVEARPALRPPSRQICFEMLFNLMGNLLRLLETLHSEAVLRSMIPPAPSPSPAGRDNGPARPTYERQLAQVRAFYERVAQRSAQSWYLGGMLLGAAFWTLVLAAFMFGLIRPQGSVPLGDDELRLLMLNFVIGGVGAIVSVMQRMTSGKLIFPPRTARFDLLLVGSFRPVIGAVFALVVYVLIMSGLLPISRPTSPNELVYFVTAIAFFAGFSERWAQDMLAAGRDQVTAAMSKESRPPAEEGSPARP